VTFPKQREKNFSQNYYMYQCIVVFRLEYHTPIPPPPLINMGRPKRLSSTVKITGEGRQIPQFHVSDYVNLPAFQIEGRKIPRSHTQNLNFSDSPLIRTLPNDDVGQERRQYFWPEAVGNENFTRKRSSVMTY
jgi:hypothetical protein